MDFDGGCELPVENQTKTLCNRLRHKLEIARGSRRVTALDNALFYPNHNADHNDKNRHKKEDYAYHSLLPACKVQPVNLYIFRLKENLIVRLCQPIDRIDP